jgi:hypothetical protein
MTDTRTVGFVYVLANPRMPGLVKVGVTHRLIEDRARALYSSGVPVAFDVEFGLTTSHPGDVERATHRLLGDSRLPGREFFEASVGEATEAVQTAAAQVAGLQHWAAADGYHSIRTGDRLALTTMAGQLFLHVYYPDPQALVTNEPEVADIWQAHSDGDSLELMAVSDPRTVISANDDDPENNSTDPVPFLDRARTFPNAPINGKERILPGERLVWLGTNKDGSACRPAVFDFDDDCQVISRTRHPQTVPTDHARHPLLLDTLTYNEIPREMIRTAHAVLENMTVPHCWAPRYANATDVRGSSPQLPEYWLHALAKRQRRQRKRE